jgi:hypothetical protein
VLRWLMGEWASARWRGLHTHAPQQPVRRWQRLTGAALFTLSLLVISVGAATEVFRALDGLRWLEQAWRSLWVAGLLLQAAATLWVVITVRPMRSDDLLRATPEGLALWVRGAWLHILRRARVLLLYLVLVRLAMIGLLLVEMTAMRGRYLDLIIAFEMAAPLPVAVMLLLIALGMTVALLLPLLALAFDAAVGLLLAYALPERTFALVYQVGWVLARWAGMAAFSWLYDRVVSGEVLTSAESVLPLYAASALLGDHGATFTSLTRMSAAWGEMDAAPWAAVMGGGLLLVYALAVELGLWAVRRRRERPD